jgi:hypothetical protein
MHAIRRRPSGATLVAALVTIVAFTPAVPTASAAQAGPLPEEAPSWPDSRDKTLRAHPRTAPIAIDGTLDEPDWAAAPVATGFVQEEPFDGQPALEDTEVRVLFDDDAIYIGALLRDSDPSRIASQLTRRDQTGRAAGYLEFSFDTNLDRSTGYSFRVTAAGVQRDEYNYDDTRSDQAWDGIWEAAVTHTAEGWVAEIRIPLSQLRYVPSEGPQTWGVNFARRRIADNERSAWAWRPRGLHGGVSRWGRLEGLVLPSASRRVEVRPYTMAGAERVTGDATNPFFEATQTTARIGTDVRIGLGSTFMLDAAVNPDFGQVEVDPQVIDLSAFETFFPERRPFFTQDDRMFDFSLSGRSNNLFYSRRIGRSPQGPAPAGATFTDQPGQTTILGAAKITGRTDAGLTLGALFAATSLERGRAFLGDQDDIVRYEAEPRSWYGTLRAQQEFRGAQSRVGGILTMVDRHLTEDGTLDLLPNRAFSGGLDFEHTWADREWALWGFLAGSHVQGSPAAMLGLQRSSNHYYQRPDQDYLVLDPSRTSLSGAEWRLQFERRGGEHWTGAVWAAQRTPGFDVNDLGFSRSTERLDGGARLRYQEREPGTWYQGYSFGFSTFHNWRHQALDDAFSPSVWRDAHKSGQVSLDARVTLRNWWNLNFDVEFAPEVLSDVATRGGPLMIEPGSWTFDIGVSTDRRDAISYGASFEWERGSRGGGEVAADFDVDFRPTSGLSLSLGPSYSRSTDPAQYVTRTTDAAYEPTYGARYVFAELDREELTLDTRIDIVLSPALTIQVFAQPLISAGSYRTYRQLLQASSFDFVDFEEGEAAAFREGVFCIGGTVCKREGRTYLDYTGDGISDTSFSERDFTVRSLRGSAVLRWEYRPGSRIYLAWQQRRQDRDTAGDFRVGRDAQALFSGAGEHFFMIKMDYWFDF